MISILVVVLLVPLSGCTSTSPSVSPTVTTEVQTLRLATTTSVQDTGLLAYLLPEFEKENNVKVQVIAKGSGEALKLGETGDVDVLIVHSPAAEDAFMAAGHGWNRTQIAHNYFVIVGPASDPAGIKGLNATEAFKKIYAANATFVSRGDNSGTASKEKDLWNKTGIKQPDNKTYAWYKSTGAGMADTLRMADQLQGYTLSDKGTYLKFQKDLSLVILADNSTDMLNKYDVIAVNQTQHPYVKYDLAKKLVDYLASQPVQQKIGEYGVKDYGVPLFYPDLLNKSS
ncbi:substrate-binding domain-containing protein [Methanocella conradii]|uniref:substrate-binding domain-containing protein n=1 Tax=Methanocella conradii TaxID=1175444 RepID=UPI0024B32DED|nr:substrate-binding domain-containing protein [Methanocella conradii]MDI6898110.1 substrate-binding domain-containing protein [Methanocella conradii]